jgi:hypothetical protein
MGFNSGLKGLTMAENRVNEVALKKINFLCACYTIN